ncbi:methyltransferase domain-containing protein [Halosegnis marinus]|uniref:Methyltransferase domain-containing protein n=1 Tax=Halosegnis marinus TaxID=3034023 RepID=A0ABD5ZNB7_9EURY|nr:methyltransferase domain-containing protein [Halosegnis sp. DT85]
MYLLELGGEDDAFAAREAASACSAVERLAPGLATARGVTDRVRGLAYTHAASDLVGTAEGGVAAAVALLEAASLDREGTVAVRARDVQATAGVSTSAAERDLGSVLVERGFAVDLDDPDHELRALFADDTVALGWLAVESVRDFGDRKPTDKPFFQPGSMDPLLARAVANIAGARPGRVVLDPMCGTGGGLVEAGLVGADVLGNDAQYKMVHGARENLARYLDGGVAGLPAPGGYDVVRGDATRLPLRDGAADCVVFDAPYGRQSKIANRSLDALVADALAEARRVADRGVLVGDRAWDDAARAAGWSVPDRYVRPVHGTLDRHVIVLRG